MILKQNEKKKKQMPHTEQEVFRGNVHVRIIFSSLNRESICMCVCYFFSTSFETETHLRLLEAAPQPTKGER